MTTEDEKKFPVVTREEQVNQIAEIFQMPVSDLANAVMLYRSIDRPMETMALVKAALKAAWQHVPLEQSAQIIDLLQRLSEKPPF